MNNLTWEANKAKLPWKRTLNGAPFFGSRILDFTAYGISRKGFLEDALNDSIWPQHFCIVNQTLRMIECHKNNPLVIQILSTPTSQLTPKQIIHLYETFETTISNNPNISQEARNTVSSQYRNMLSKCSMKLINGESVKSIRFRSKFFSHIGAVGRLAASKKKLAKSLLNEDRLGSLAHDSAESLRINMHQMAQDDLTSINDVCWEAINAYKSIRDLHKNLLDRYRDEPCPQHYFWSTKPDLSLGLKLAELVRIGFHTSEGFQFLNESQKNKSQKKSNINRTLKLEHAFKFVQNPFFQRWRHKVSAYEYFSCLFYMPRVVMEAAKCLLLTYSAWNVGTLCALTPRHFIKRSGYYIINSVKTKTNTTESIKVFIRTQPALYGLIDLLLEHNANVDKYAKRLNDNVWVTWSTNLRNEIIFRVSKTSLENNYISSPFGLNKFSKKQLRDQVATVRYLEEPDPFKLKELLGHRDVNTTIVYLNHLVLRLMHQSHVKRFMDRLATTIVWAVGGNQAVSQRGMALEEIDDRLLFPLGDSAGSKTALCDLWVDSMGAMKIKIGEAEIGHLKWQIAYYSEYSLSLKQDNPKRFIMYHVPRIIFCTALAEIVRHSPYCSYLD